MAKIGDHIEASDDLLIWEDAFGDEDTVQIYQNILECKLKFPSDFDRDAKSLIKHLLMEVN